MLDKLTQTSVSNSQARPALKNNHGQSRSKLVGSQCGEHSANNPVVGGSDIIGPNSGE